MVPRNWSKKYSNRSKMFKEMPITIVFYFNKETKYRKNNNLMPHRSLKYWNGNFHSATIYGTSASRRIITHYLTSRLWTISHPFRFLLIL